jgi:septum formation protein
MTRLILASSSPTRREMLSAAKITFEVVPPDVDEDAVKDAALAKGERIDDIALRLAEAKAKNVAARHPDALVLGADQVLVCGGKLFSKAKTMEDARETLRAFRGRTHRLISAAALVSGHQILWGGSDAARLTVREFSEGFLDAYLKAEGDSILGSVGCYRIEAAGVHLFEQIEGDQFTIRGLPFMALLESLREQGILAR